MREPRESSSVMGATYLFSIWPRYLMTGVLVLLGAEAARGQDAMSHAEKRAAGRLALTMWSSLAFVAILLMTIGVLWLIIRLGRRRYLFRNDKKPVRYFSSRVAPTEGGDPEEDEWSNDQDGPANA